jgi:hypothetical protein
MPKADHADLFAWKSLVGKLIERSDEMIALVVRKARCISLHLVAAGRAGELHS